eukprot:5516178-Prymnesium_polylepis.1
MKRSKTDPKCLFHFCGSFGERLKLPGIYFTAVSAVSGTYAVSATYPWHCVTHTICMRRWLCPQDVPLPHGPRPAALPQAPTPAH